MTRTEEILQEISSLNDGIFSIGRLVTYLASLDERVKKLEPIDQAAIVRAKTPKEPVSWEEELKCLGAAYTLACTKNYDRDMQELESFIAEEKGKSFEEGWIQGTKLATGT